MNNKLEGKVAIVTVHPGYRRGNCQALAAHGAAVVVNYSSSRDARKKVVSEIVSAGGKASAIKANVAKAEEIPQLFEASESAFGELDNLVKQCGIYQPAPIGTITAESFHKHFDLKRTRRASGLAGGGGALWSGRWHDREYQLGRRPGDAAGSRAVYSASRERWIP